MTDMTDMSHSSKMKQGNKMKQTSDETRAPNYTLSSCEWLQTVEMEIK